MVAVCHAERQTTATETVVVDQVKQYTVTLSYFAATLTVTAESGRCR